MNAMIDSGADPADPAYPAAATAATEAAAPPDNPRVVPLRQLWSESQGAEGNVFVSHKAGGPSADP